MKEFVLKQDFDPNRCKIKYAEELNPEQLDVVQKGDGPCLVLAGAGSGKTRTITYRVAYLIENGIAPENILLVTFTNKAAREMLSRVEAHLGTYPKGLWGGTFHSVANRILRIHFEKIGFSSNFTIMDQDDAKSLIKVCIKELKIDTTARRFPSPAKLLGIISYARNAGRSLGDVVESRYSTFMDLLPNISSIADLYASRKRAADAMDFDDLLLLLRDLLQTNPVLRDRLATQFQYILVDEYQDTNVVQAEIIRSLSSVHGNVLVVGDDAQSIYSFRAAEIRNILGFPKTHQGCQTFKLTTNYRSAPEILEVANAAIAMNTDQFKKELTAVRSSEERPNVVPASNSFQEAQYIAQQILSLRDDGVPLREIAVLFRAAFHSQALEFELMKRDIPYEYRGGLKFFERAHVKDVVAHLRMMVNYKDELAWMRVLGKQPGIGLVTAGKIIKQIQEFGSIEEVGSAELRAGARAQSGLKSVQATVKKLLSDNNQPSEMIRTIVSGDYRDYIEAEYPDFMDRLDDLEQFALFAEGYKSLTKFLDEVSLTDEYGASHEYGASRDEERMILSTVHQSKGLEWDAVFIINLCEGKFPNQRALSEKGGLEEERRLFYVATTRARKHLFYTYPITSGYDTLEIGLPSTFLQELPEELCENVRLKMQQSSRPRFGSSDSEFSDGPTIVFNDLGEEVETKLPTGMSFLRGIDEL